MNRLAASFAALLLVSACTGAAPGPSPGEGQLTIVTTTTVLADMVREVAGDRAIVHALVPSGAEVHTYDPAPSDVARLAGADLLVLNGLGLDDWLLDLARDAAQQDLPVVELAEDLDGVEYIEADPDDDHGTGDDDHAYNPHLWLDVSYARLYVERLREELALVDPAGSATYEANAASYDARLADLDASIAEQMRALPEQDRKVVSFHDAFPYFAAAYDLVVVGVVVSAPGQEPSAAEVAGLISAIRDSGVKVILAEAQFSDQLAQMIAAETGAQVVSELYTDSLGDQSLDTYESAMRWNTEAIVEGLR